MNLIDTHCHLAHGRLRQDIPDVLMEAGRAGVGQIVCAAADMDDSRAALDIARKYNLGGECMPRVWATAGIHPHDAKDTPTNYIHQLEELLSRDECVALGEIGLDYHYDFSPREDQRRAFGEQLDFARRLDCPVVIHMREAFDETMTILAESGVAGQHVIFHSFTSGPDEARRCLDFGAAISFSGIATFKTAEDIRAAAVLCPEGRILVETDAPYLSPEPVRKVKRNVPAHVVHVAMRLAEERNIAPKDFASQTTANAIRLFRLDR